MGALILNLPHQLVTADLGPRVPTFTLRLEAVQDLLQEWHRLPKSVVEAFRGYGLDAMDVQLHVFAACGLGPPPAAGKPAPPAAPKSRTRKV